MPRPSMPSALALAGALVLALAGCASGGDAPSESGASSSSGGSSVGEVDDQTRSPAYSIDVASVRPSMAGGAPALLVRANVTDVNGAEFSPVATVLYDDGTTVECRFDRSTYPVLDAPVKELQIPCSSPLRIDEPAQITILDDFTRLV